VYRSTVSRFRVAALYTGAAVAGVVFPRELVTQERDSASATGAIAGVVRDSGGARLIGANLSVNGTTLRAISDTAGRFRFVGVPAGAGALYARRLGYRAASFPITVEVGNTTSITVTLARLPRELDPVLVEASRQPAVRYLQGFYERRSRGHGYFVTRDQISTRQWSDMTDVLRSLVPAVRISSSRLARNAVRLRGSRCAPLVWLDGAPAMAGEFDLDVITPESVSGIEIYPGPATVPIEFRSTRGLESCGVIVVWSRVDAPSITRSPPACTAPRKWTARPASIRPGCRSRSTPTRSMPSASAARSSHSSSSTRPARCSSTPSPRCRPRTPRSPKRSGGRCGTRSFGRRCSRGGESGR
jgi:hypothetical protein